VRHTAENVRDRYEIFLQLLKMGKFKFITQLGFRRYMLKAVENNEWSGSGLEEHPEMLDPYKFLLRGFSTVAKLPVFLPSADNVDKIPDYWIIHAPRMALARDWR